MTASRTNTHRRSRRHVFTLATVVGCAALACSAEAGFNGLHWETHEGADWVSNGYAGLVTYRLYACFSGDPDDGVLAAYAQSDLPMSVQSTNGAFHNDAVFDALTAPFDRTGNPWFYWGNQWDTYVTVGADDADGDATAVSPGFGAETNELGSNWTTGNASWFVTPVDGQGLAVDNRVLLAQFTVAAGETVSGTLNLFLWDQTTVEQVTFDTALPSQCAGNGPIPFSGMLTLPKGDAELEPVGHDHLIVSNIGSSGDDGVEIDLGESDGYGLMVDDFASPLGAYREIRLFGQYDGRPDRLIATRRYEVVDPGEGEGDIGILQVSHDSSALGATRLGVTAYAEDGSTLYDTILPNGPLYKYVGWPVHTLCIIDETITNDPGGEGNTGPRYNAIAAFPEPVEFVDGTRVADVYRVEVREVDARFAPSYASSVEDTGARMGAFELMQSTLAKFGIQHLALGQAMYEHVCHDCLVISNIGASGDDGVESHVDPLVGAWRAEWQELQRTDDDAELRVLAHGRVGARKQDFGTVRTYRQRGGLFMEADFSAIGASTMTVEIFDGARIVARFEGVQGQAAEIFDWPRAAESLLAGTDDELSLAIGMGLGDSTRIVFGGEVYTGDTLRFIAERPTVRPEALSTVALTLRNFEELFVTRERVTEAACAGDVDGDGVIGFGDILSILAAWGPCGSCPQDLDENGFVDFADLLIVLAQWGAC